MMPNAQTEMTVSMGREFSKAVAFAAGAVEATGSGNTYIPILRHILIEANGGFVRVIGTDLETSAIADFFAEVPDFSVTVPAKAFAKAVGAEGDCRLAISDLGVALVTATSETWFPTLPSDDFPSLATVRAEKKMTKFAQADYRELTKHLNRAATCASKEPTRNLLQSILLYGGVGFLGVDATDGHRAYRGRMARSLHFKREILLTSAATKLVAKIPVPKGLSPNVSIESDDLICRIKTTVETVAYQVTCKSADGQYPQLDRVVPKKFDNVSRVNRKELLDAVKSATTHTSHKAQTVHLNCLHDESITVTAKGDHGGSFRKIVPVLGTNSFTSDREIAMNGRLFVEILAKIETREIEFSTNSPLSPMGIAPSDDSGDIFYLMPLKP